MQKRLIILLIAFGFIAQAQTTFSYKNDFKTILAKTKDASDKLNYDKLLSRFQINDSTLTNAEVLALMIGFTARPEYKPSVDLKEERAIYNLNAEGKYDAALKKADEFLKTHPLSIKAIYELSFSYYKAGNTEMAKFYVKQGQRLFNAMTYSGNGKTKQTPIFALSAEDGQEYIYKFLQGGIGEMDSARDDEGNNLDILEATFKVGEPYKLFFISEHGAGNKK